MYLSTEGSRAERSSSSGFNSTLAFAWANNGWIWTKNLKLALRFRDMRQLKRFHRDYIPDDDWRLCRIFTLAEATILEIMES